MKRRFLWALSGSSFVVFLIISVAVKTSPSLLNWDVQAALWVNRLSLGDFANWVLVNASLYGREYFWIPLVAFLLILGDKRTRVVALGLVGVFAVGIVAGELAKEVVARPRPFTFLPAFSLQGQYILRIPLETDYSFPSGHALIVSIGAAYSVLAFRRKWVSALLVIEAAVVWFSRVYTFEHFPTDVVGGAALGAAIALGGLAFSRGSLGQEVRESAERVIRPFRDGPVKV